MIKIAFKNLFLNDKLSETTNKKTIVLFSYQNYICLQFQIKTLIIPKRFYNFVENKRFLARCMDLTLYLVTSKNLIKIQRSTYYIK